MNTFNDNQIKSQAQIQELHHVIQQLATGAQNQTQANQQIANDMNVLRDQLQRQGQHPPRHVPPPPPPTHYTPPTLDLKLPPPPPFLALHLTFALFSYAYASFSVAARHATLMIIPESYILVPR